MLCARPSQRVSSRLRLIDSESLRRGYVAEVEGGERDDATGRARELDRNGSINTEAVNGRVGATPLVARHVVAVGHHAPAAASAPASIADSEPTIHGTAGAILMLTIVY